MTRNLLPCRAVLAPEVGRQATARESGADAPVVEFESGAGKTALPSAGDALEAEAARARPPNRGTRVADPAGVTQADRPYAGPREDVEIARAVRQALESDGMMPAEKIRSSVREGWVTLEGEVPFLADLSHAERAVCGLPGVRGVSNHLAVRATCAAVETVRNSIEAALERRAEREAGRLRVEMRDGKVLLAGRVHNVKEKIAIIGAASHAGGVRAVEDHLLVDPYF